MCKKLIVLVLSLCLISSAGASTIVWDFENGDTHRFILQSAYPAAVGVDDPNTAGDEEITGAGGFRGLPDAGIAWTVGPPTQFDGLKPAADVGNARVDANGLLDYSLGTERIATESGTLNTYNLNQHGDYIHTQENDQIASSLPVLLQENAVLSVWSWGGGSDSHAPEYDPDPAFWYTDGSSGIAVISASGDDMYAILATIHTQGKGTLTEDTLDLSAFAGKQVFIDVVDAFQGGWGWLAVDKIQITNAFVPIVNWDFENGNDHGFILSCVNPATPAPDDPNIAGDESLTGVGGDNGLPDAGNAWSIGVPYEYNGLIPAVEEGCHVVDGVLEYGPCNDPYRYYEVDTPTFINIRGQESYLNTYNLSQWGDDLHTRENDQIATSPPVLLLDGAMLTVWSQGGGNGTHVPALDPDPNEGYTTGSSGVAVLSAEDGSLLASVYTQNQKDLLENTLDLSAFAGQTVIIEVVDAFEGGWGWIAVDEIEIINAKLVEPEMVAHWSMDDGAGTVVTDSAGSNDGEIVGNVTWIADGALDGAVSYDVTDPNAAILVPHAAELDFGDVDFSISLMVRYPTVPGDPEHQLILKGSFGGDTESGSRYVLFNKEGRYRFEIDNGPANVKSGGLSIDNAPVVTGEWVHVVVVRDSVNDLLSMYINGAVPEGGTSTDVSGDISSGEDLYIGNSMRSGATSEADIDDVRIFDVALTEDEIAAIY